MSSSDGRVGTDIDNSHSLLTKKEMNDGKLFQFSGNAFGHSGDVRALALIRGGEEERFVSVSRDRSIGLWKRKDDNKTEFVCEIFKGKCHDNYISSVCHMKMENDVNYIVSGSNDKSIKVFNLRLEEVKKLEKHENAISCLTQLDETSLLISGGWDHQIIIWNLETFNYVNSLTHHSAAIWKVKSFKWKKNGEKFPYHFASASADGNIILWEGKNEYSFQPMHSLKCENCVRSICFIANRYLLAASNDLLIRCWDLETRQLKKIMSGHRSFIYDVIPFNDNNDDLNFISVGEEHSMIIWKKGKLFQRIDLPAISAWCCIRLSESRIAVGLSDYSIRIFTNNSTEYALTKELESMNESINKLLKSSKDKEGSGGTTESSPGNWKEQLGELLTLDQLEKLTTMKEGDVHVIDENNVPVAYQYHELKWIRMGNILGEAADNSKVNQPNNSNRVRHDGDGKYYDFVFQVNIADDSPTLPLPYNLEDDEWEVARKFINKHQLNSSFLDQIVQFIRTNSKKYSNDTSNPTEQHFVVEKMEKLPIIFNRQISANLDRMFAKLKEINTMNQFFKNDDEIMELKDFCRKVMAKESLENDEPLVGRVMQKILRFLQTYRTPNTFPMLDTLRIVVTAPEVQKYLKVQIESTNKLLELMSNNLAMKEQNELGETIEGMIPTKMLILRFMANFFAIELFDQLIISHTKPIMMALRQMLIISPNQSNHLLMKDGVQVSLSNVCKNLVVKSIHFRQQLKNNEADKFLEYAMSLMIWINNSIAYFSTSQSWHRNSVDTFICGLTYAFQNPHIRQFIMQSSISYESIEQFINGDYSIEYDWQTKTILSVIQNLLETILCDCNSEYSEYRSALLNDVAIMTIDS
ncbi:hypothetical protein SNEBB_006013 [Seison nebaliae]|nr:hypothetical protein SNEBB_006013 [Seison nebaliae]